MFLSAQARRWSLAAILPILIGMVAACGDAAVKRNPDGAAVTVPADAGPGADTRFDAARTDAPRTDQADTGTGPADVVPGDARNSDMGRHLDSAVDDVLQADSGDSGGAASDASTGDRQSADASSDDGGGAAAFSFVVVSDVHAYAGSSYDSDGYFAGICDKIEQVGKGAFLINCGDMFPPMSRIEWTLTQHLGLGTDYTWYPVVGNHELDPQRVAAQMSWLRAFNPGGNSLPRVVNPGPAGSFETMYSFDHENAHFVILNVYYDGVSDIGDTSLEPNDRDDIEDATFAWLSADLAATNKQHIFVFGHPPRDKLGLNTTYRQRFWDLLRQHDVVAYIAGHVHRYSHTEQDGVHQLTAPDAKGWSPSIDRSGDGKTGFIKITVDGARVSFDSYLSAAEHAGPYIVADSGVLAAGEPPKAFPQAEGFGANAVGGRGGAVLFVDNLNDSGPGSLRAAINASGPRTVIFRTSGTIVLNSALRVQNPYLTIAGQTAPGDGIALRAAATASRVHGLSIETHDVIVRFLRIRPGPTGNDGLHIESGARDVIVDHCSVSWGMDENMCVTADTENITIQWSISSEAIKGVTGISGHHSMGLLAYGRTLSFHHNLFAHNVDRNPRSDGGDVVDYVNNVFYNGYQGASFAPENCVPDGCSTAECCFFHVNFVGNYYQRGPNSLYGRNDPPAGNGDYEMRMHYSQYGNNTNTSLDGVPIYLAGNIGPNRPSDALPQHAILIPNRRDYVVTTRFAAPPVRTTDAFAAYTEVLAHAGARRPGTDAVDTRIIAEVLAGTGDLVDLSPEEVGGWPALDTAVAPADRDGDGMPDTWESARGLDPDRASDRNDDDDDDGYTNLEAYLNGLAANTFPW